MADILIAFGIGIFVGIGLVVVTVMFWPPPMEEHEEVFVRSGAPPDPNDKLIKQLKRTNHRLERLLNDPHALSPQEILKTISQTKKTISDVKDSPPE